MRIAHLSDSHLRGGPLGGGPAEALAVVFGRLLALEPRPDCVVITGDLVDRGDPEGYEVLRAVLARCPVPVHATTGNHDDPAAFVAALGTSTRYAVDYPEATIVALDSWVSGSPAGRLGPEQLAWLDETLRDRRATPALVCLHHPPVPVGIPFLDGMRLEDGPELAAVVARHPHVVRVLAGHVHRSISVPFAGTLVTVAPSTYRQTALRMHDDAPPGYLAEPTGFLLHVLDGGRCATHTVAASHAGAVLAF